MKELLKRYWFKTEEGLGIGVTAFDLDDAKSLIKAEEYILNYKPKFNEYIEDIAIQELDQNHVIPNMGIVVDRGIWFPNLGKK